MSNRGQRGDGMVEYTTVELTGGGGDGGDRDRDRRYSSSGKLSNHSTHSNSRGLQASNHSSSSRRQSSERPGERQQSSSSRHRGRSGERHHQQHSSSHQQQQHHQSRSSQRPSSSRSSKPSSSSSSKSGFSAAPWAQATKVVRRKSREGMDMIKRSLSRERRHSGVELGLSLSESDDSDVDYNGISLKKTSGNIKRSQSEDGRKDEEKAKRKKEEDREKAKRDEKKKAEKKKPQKSRNQLEMERRISKRISTSAKVGSGSSGGRVSSSSSGGRMSKSAAVAVNSSGHESSSSNHNRRDLGSVSDHYMPTSSSKGGLAAISSSSRKTRSTAGSSTGRSRRPSEDIHDLSKSGARLYAPVHTTRKGMQQQQQQPQGLGMDSGWGGSSTEQQSRQRPERSGQYMLHVSKNNNNNYVRDDSLTDLDSSGNMDGSGHGLPSWNNGSSSNHSDRGSNNGSGNSGKERAALLQKILNDNSGHKTKPTTRRVSSSRDDELLQADNRSKVLQRHTSKQVPLNDNSGHSLTQRRRSSKDEEGQAMSNNNHLLKLKQHSSSKQALNDNSGHSLTQRRRSSKDEGQVISKQALNDNSGHSLTQRRRSKDEGQVIMSNHPLMSRHSSKQASKDSSGNGMPPRRVSSEDTLQTSNHSLKLNDNSGHNLTQRRRASKDELLLQISTTSNHTPMQRRRSKDEAQASENLLMLQRHSSSKQTLNDNNNNSANNILPTRASKDESSSSNSMNLLQQQVDEASRQIQQRQGTSTSTRSNSSDNDVVTMPIRESLSDDLGNNHAVALEDDDFLEQAVSAHSQDSPRNQKSKFVSLQQQVDNVARELQQHQQQQERTLSSNDNDEGVNLIDLGYNSDNSEEEKKAGSSYDDDGDGDECHLSSGVHHKLPPLGPLSEAYSQEGTESRAGSSENNRRPHRFRSTSTHTHRKNASSFDSCIEKLLAETPPSRRNKLTRRMSDQDMRGHLSDDDVDSLKQGTSQSSRRIGKRRGSLDSSLTRDHTGITDSLPESTKQVWDSLLMLATQEEEEAEEAEEEDENCNVDLKQQGLEQQQQEVITNNKPPRSRPMLGRRASESSLQQYDSNGLKKQTTTTMTTREKNDYYKRRRAPSARRLSSSFNGSATNFHSLEDIMNLEEEDEEQQNYNNLRRSKSFESYHRQNDDLLAMLGEVGDEDFTTFEDEDLKSRCDKSASAESEDTGANANADTDFLSLIEGVRTKMSEQKIKARTKSNAPDRSSETHRADALDRISEDCRADASSRNNENRRPNTSSRNNEDRRPDTSSRNNEDSRPDTSSRNNSSGKMRTDKVDVGATRRTRTSESAKEFDPAELEEAPTAAANSKRSNHAANSKRSNNSTERSNGRGKVIRNDKVDAAPSRRMRKSDSAKDFDLDEFDEVSAANSKRSNNSAASSKRSNNSTLNSKRAKDKNYSSKDRRMTSSTIDVAVEDPDNCTFNSKEDDTLDNSWVDSKKTTSTAGSSRAPSRSSSRRSRRNSRSSGNSRDKNDKWWEQTELKLSPVLLCTVCCCYCVSLLIVAVLGFGMFMVLDGRDDAKDTSNAGNDVESFGSENSNGGMMSGKDQVMTSSFRPSLAPSLRPSPSENDTKMEIPNEIDGMITTVTPTTLENSNLPTPYPTYILTTPLPSMISSSYPSDTASLNPSSLPSLSKQPSPHPSSLSEQPSLDPSGSPSFSPTSSPECPEQLLKSVALGDDNLLTLKYEVVIYPGDAGKGLGGLFCASLEYSGTAGWMGIAFSKASRDPQFGKKEAVIGMPGMLSTMAMTSANDSTNSAGQHNIPLEGGPVVVNPGKYKIPAGGLEGFYGPSLSLLSGIEKQSLVNGSVSIQPYENDDGINYGINSGQSHSQMSFAKYLREPGEIELKPLERTLLLYAVAPLDVEGEYDGNPEWKYTYLTLLEESSDEFKSGLARKRKRQHDIH